MKTKQIISIRVSPETKKFYEDSAKAFNLTTSKYLGLILEAVKRGYSNGKKDK